MHLVPAIGGRRIFADRRDAGQRLAAALVRLAPEQPCVLALPRGGVPVAFEVATLLKAPLDLVMVRKIGAPGQPELALGAVVDGNRPELVLNEDIVALSGASEAHIAAEQARQLREIERRREAYLAGRARVDVAGRTALIIDDGIATGATARAAIRAIRRAAPKQLILAVPVAPTQTIAELREEVDDIVCLESREDFRAISMSYANFTQVTDEEVRDLMSRAALLAAMPHPIEASFDERLSG